MITIDLSRIDYVNAYAQSVFCTKVYVMLALYSMLLPFYIIIMLKSMLA